MEEGKHLEVVEEQHPGDEEEDGGDEEHHHHPAVEEAHPHLATPAGAAPLAWSHGLGSGTLLPHFHHTPFPNYSETSSRPEFK